MWRRAVPSLMRALDGPVAAAARSLGPQLSAPQQCACAASFQAQHQWLAGQHWTRRLMASLSPAEYDKRIEDINALFVEARDEIEFAKEDAETTYFNQSVEAAKRAVDACLDSFQQLASELSEEEKGKLMRSMGLKMEQLKAEFDEVASIHLEDH